MKKVFWLIPLLLMLHSCDVVYAQFWVTGYWPTWSMAGPTAQQLDFNVWTVIVKHSLEPTQSPPYFSFQNGQQTFETANGTGYTYPAARSVIDSAHIHGKKVILCLGGGNTGGNWTWMLANGHFYEYVHNVMDYIRLWGYDGIDIDWEWNPCGADLVTFNRMVHVFRDSLGAGKLITVASWPFVSQTCWNADTINAYVDQLNVMEYDMNWSTPMTMHDAPLHAYTCDANSQTRTIETQMAAYAAKGIKKSILGLGIPFYCFVWPVGPSDICQPQKGNAGGNYMYSYANNIAKSNPSAYHFDPVAQNSYLGYTDVTGGHFISYDDSLTIYYKTKWAKDNGYGGVMFWEIGRGVEAGGKLEQTKLINKAIGGAAPPPVTFAVSISSPSNKDTVGIPLTFSSVTSLPADSIRWFVDGIYMLTNISTPTVTWTPATVGTNLISAIAYKGGNKANSNVITITVYAKYIPPPSLVCNYDSAKATVKCPAFPDTAKIRSDGFNAGKASVVCVVCPPYPDTLSIIRRWLSLVPDSVRIPLFIAVPKPKPQ